MSQLNLPRICLLLLTGFGLANLNWGLVVVAPASSVLPLQPESFLGLFSSGVLWLPSSSLSVPSSMTVLSSLSNSCDFTLSPPIFSSSSSLKPKSSFVALVLMTLEILSLDWVDLLVVVVMVVMVVVLVVVVLLSSSGRARESELHKKYKMKSMVKWMKCFACNAKALQWEIPRQF